jgi:hypothetical protein
LSDLEVDEEDPSNIDEVVSGTTHSPPHKEINPRTPIGDLKIEDVLGFLIQTGAQTLNPQLKYGALNLLQQLTGRRRRRPGPPPHRGGYQNQRGGHFQGPPGGRRGNGPTMGQPMPRGNRQMGGQTDELYPD